MARLLRILGLAITLAVLTGLAACAAPTATPLPAGPRDQIYGRWVYQDNRQQAELIFEFQRGGVLLLGSEGVYLETTFSFVDDQTIRIDQESDEPIEMNWRVEGDTLILSNDEEVQVLQRRDN